MREQVIAHKVGNRSGIGGQRRSGAVAQRPSRRESGGEALAARLRALLGYVPAFLKVVLAIVIGLVIFAGYRAAASASFFQVRNVEVQGASRVSGEEVQALVRREVEKTGVWKADLERNQRAPRTAALDKNSRGLARVAGRHSRANCRASSACRRKNRLGTFSLGGRRRSVAWRDVADRSNSFILPARFE